jgi:hypothetical protein
MVSYGETGKDFEFAFKALKSAYKEVTGEEYSPEVLVADIYCAYSRVNLFRNLRRCSFFVYK